LTNPTKLDVRATCFLEASVEFHLIIGRHVADVSGGIRISSDATTLFAVLVTREGARPYICEQLKDITHCTFFGNNSLYLFFSDPG
jgi:hypothetical protein